MATLSHKTLDAWVWKAILNDAEEQSDEWEWKYVEDVEEGYVYCPDDVVNFFMDIYEEEGNDFNMSDEVRTEVYSCLDTVIKKQYNIHEALKMPLKEFISLYIHHYWFPMASSIAEELGFEERPDEE